MKTKLTCSAISVSFVFSAMRASTGSARSSGISDRAGAEDAWGEWSAADDTNARPVEQLMGMLVEDGNARQAVAAGETLQARLPGNRKNEDALAMPLGKAKLALGLQP